MTTRAEIDCKIALAVGRSAIELAGLRRRLDRVECQLETVFVATGHNPTTDELAALQEIDIVVQSIDALAGFLERLGCERPDTTDEVVAAALDALPLRDMAGRLSGRDACPAGGGTELF